MFAVYRVLVNFWMILGLSFFGSLISIMSNAINELITKKAPSFLSSVVNMGNILHIIKDSGMDDEVTLPGANAIKKIVPVEKWAKS